MYLIWLKVNVGHLSSQSNVISIVKGGFHNTTKFLLHARGYGHAYSDGGTRGIVNQSAVIYDLSVGNTSYPLESSGSINI